MFGKVFILVFKYLESFYRFSNTLVLSIVSPIMIDVEGEKVEKNIIKLKHTKGVQK